MKTFYCHNCNKTYAVQDDLPDEKMVCPNCDAFLFDQVENESDKATKQQIQSVFSSQDIQLAQLKSLCNIESMMKFFVILTIVSLLISIIGAISIANLF